MSSLNDRTKDMMTRPRVMLVLNSGVWQKGEGVWIDILNYKARVILHGKELICDGKHFLDMDGYGSKDITLEIIRKNISTLPKFLKKKQSLEPPRRRMGDIVLQPYRVVNRDGRTMALPYGQMDDIDSPSLAHIILGNGPQVEGGNNV